MRRLGITLRVNGKTFTASAEPRKTLADFIREDCGLTGTHLGCEHGVCGACTILMNGRTVRSCLMFPVQAEGAELMTVEGLADGDRLHAIQQAYWDHHALQCGFCTPGFLMTTVEFLQDHPQPTEREIREGLAGNLCRCTGYQNIVKAVAAASQMVAADPHWVPRWASPEPPTAARASAGNGGTPTSRKRTTRSKPVKPSRSPRRRRPKR
jgi:carbon-monoxide dehydrogenase small subunit